MIVTQCDVLETLSPWEVKESVEYILKYLEKDVVNADSVSQEMSAKELLHIELRMIGKYLDAWDEYSNYVIDGKVDEAVQFAKTWAQEHPEKRNEE